MNAESVAIRLLFRSFGAVALVLFMVMAHPTTAVAALKLKLNIEGQAEKPSFDIVGSVNYDPGKRKLTLDIEQVRDLSIHNPLFCHDYEEGGSGVVVDVNASHASAQRLLRGLVQDADIIYQPSDKTLTLSPRSSVQCFYTNTPGNLEGFGLFGVAAASTGDSQPPEVIAGLIFRDRFSGEVTLKASYEIKLDTDGELQYDIIVSNEGNAAASQIFIQELVSTAQRADITDCELQNLEGERIEDCPDELSSTTSTIEQLALALPSFELAPKTRLVLSLKRDGLGTDATEQLLGVVNGPGRSAPFATARR